MLHKDTTLCDAAFSDDDTPMPETVNDPITGEPAFKVVWKGQGYRGYWETEPLEGAAWTKIKDGWVGGEWDDLGDENRSSSVEEAINEIAKTRELLIVIAPSSNVFAMMFDLYERVPAEVPA